MARVDDLLLTILPLEYFRRQVVDIDPYHFWQMIHTDHPERGYSHVYPQERWMYTTQLMSPQATSAKRGPGRLDFLQAIAEAESSIASVSELNTWPAPKYTEAEEVIIHSPSEFNIAYPSRQVPYGLKTRWWQVRRVGVQTWDPLQAAVAIVYDVPAASDDATVTIVTTVDADELVIAYPGTEVPIRPIEVSKVGNTATITVKKWLCGDPADWETADPINADDTTNLLQTVDIYRVWVDPSDQILMAWEPAISGCDTCSDGTCLACQLSTQTACAFRKDYKIGHIGWQYATWDAVSGSYTIATIANERFPEKAYVNYMHGFPLDGDRYYSQKWQRTVSILAAAMLPAYVYDTTSQPQQLAYWREDFTKQEGKSKHNIGQSAMINRFGSNRGHIHAWNAVKDAIGD